MVFPTSNPEYNDIDAAHYAYRAQDRIQKEILVPLRKALGVPKGVSLCHLNLLYPTIWRNSMRKSLIKQLHVTILVEIAVFPFKNS